MSNPTNPFSWQMPTPTDLVTDLPADFEVFGQAVATSLADLLGGTSGQVLSKNSNTDMDFVWVTSDDANAIQNSIVNAKGDIIGASANDTPAITSVGANGTTLVADSTAATGLKWGNANSVGCSIYNSTNFSIANATQTTLTFNFEVFDTNGFHSTVTNTDRITIPTGKFGKYLINASVVWDKNATGVREMRVYRNGSTAAISYQLNATATQYAQNNISYIADVNDGDFLQLTVYQNSGGSLIAYGNIEDCKFSAMYLGA